MANAARIGDMHTCPQFNGSTPHHGGPILPPGSTNVFIKGQPAARSGDQCLCAGAIDSIINGSTTVFIGGRSAARIGDPTAHGGLIIQGCASVNIGG